MAVAAFVIGFLALGAAVAYVAFWGGPSGARQAYLTRGRRGFRIAIIIIYVGLGIAVPALVLANGNAAKGEGGSLAAGQGNSEFNKGKGLFRQSCWSCHTLKAAGAQGVTGPNLDEIGQVTPQRVENAIRIGGTGTGRMPPQLQTGDNAKAIAYYVSQVAGR
jgi:mono/diheme cytochrome c family protein